MKKILLSLMVSLLLALPVTADDAAPYTYQDLSESLSLNNTSVLAAVENYKTALLDVKDAKANFHPQIDYTLAASYVLNHQTMTIDTGSVLDSLPTNMLYIYNPAFSALGNDSHMPLSGSTYDPDCLIVLLYLVAHLKELSGDGLQMLGDDIFDDHVSSGGCCHAHKCARLYLIGYDGIL